MIDALSIHRPNRNAGSQNHMKPYLLLQQMKKHCQQSAQLNAKTINQLKRNIFCMSALFNLFRSCDHETNDIGMTNFRNIYSKQYVIFVVFCRRWHTFLVDLISDKLNEAQGNYWRVNGFKCNK